MRSTGDATAFTPRWWVPGDWNGFFGLFTNVLLNVIVLTGLCLGVVQLPGDVVFGRVLPALGIAQLIVCGVTTEVCVNTSVREANDRGYDCLVVEDCCGSYFPEFQEMGLKMIKAQGGIFGWVAPSNVVIAALEGGH